jgi:hypothetical protein
MAHVSLPSYKLGWYVMYYTPFLAVYISFRFGFEICFHTPCNVSLFLFLSLTHARARTHSFILRERFSTFAFKMYP